MNRNLSIDNAKGIGIILVVWGHFLVPDPPLFKEIFYFHMPLFFIIAGCFHKESWSISSLCKRTKQLLVPVLIFSVAFLCLSFLKTRFGVVRPIFSIFNDFNIDKPLQYLDAPLWFLVVLYLNTLFAILINKLKIRKVWKFLIALLISWLGTWLAQLPVYLTQALATFVFYFSGYCMKKTILNEDNFKTKLLIGGGFVLMCCLNTDIVNIHELQFGDNYLMYLLGGFSGTFLVLALCMKIKKVPMLLRLGQNSLAIMAIHQPIRGYFLQGLHALNNIIPCFVLNAGVVFVFLIGFSYLLGLAYTHICNRYNILT